MCLQSCDSRIFVAVLYIILRIGAGDGEFHSIEQKVYGYDASLPIAFSQFLWRKYMGSNEFP